MYRAVISAVAAAQEVVVQLEGYALGRGAHDRVVDVVWVLSVYPIHTRDGHVLLAVRQVLYVAECLEKQQSHLRLSDSLRVEIFGKDCQWCRFFILLDTPLPADNAFCRCQRNQFFTAKKFFLGQFASPNHLVTSLGYIRFCGGKVLSIVRVAVEELSQKGCVPMSP